MKKLLLIFAIIMCAFAYKGSGYGSTDQTGAGTWTFDAVTVNGTVTLENGGTITNPHGDTILVTEDVLKISGDIRIMGNDIVFATGAVITNNHADSLALTEAVVYTSGDILIKGNNLIFGNGADIGNIHEDSLYLNEAVTKLLELVATGAVTIDGITTFNDASAWMIDDTLFWTDGGADTSGCVQDGNNFKFFSDNSFRFAGTIYSDGSFVLDGDAYNFASKGENLTLDSDADDDTCSFKAHDTGVLRYIPATDMWEFTDGVKQETYVIRKHVALSGAADNSATAMFTITTTDETGSADGGMYSVSVHTTVGEATAAEGAVNTASVGLLTHWTRIMASAGTGANSAIVEVNESASADEGSGAISAVTMTVAETSEFVQTVSIQVDTSGGTADAFAIVELVYSDFTTAPVIAVP